MSDLPIYVDRGLIQERLPFIFPEGTQNRNYCIRELAASTIFAMLYIGAVEGADSYMGPVHVYRMTSEQAALSSEEDRIDYRLSALKQNVHGSKRWYADNTREPIRDETLREGLLYIGAVLSLKDVPTTSSKPRYFLQKDFGALFNPFLIGEAFNDAVKKWQENHLSKSALTRISLAGLSLKGQEGNILVTFPNGETRNLSAGPSSEISKSVIEDFAHRFLEEPAVLWLSTSDNKVVSRDDKLASSIGITIDANKDLPDIILVDLAPRDPLLAFIEVVASDGPISERRQKAIFELTDAAEFSRTQIVFVSVYLDRQSAGFKKTVSQLAWNSYAWFVSEPDKLIVMKDGVSFISALIKI